MTSSFAMRSLAAFVMVVFFAPTAFMLVPPPKAHAVTYTVMEVGKQLWASYGSYVTNGYQLIKDTLISTHTFTSMVAQQALVFNAFVLQPLAFIMSGNLLKALTAGVIAFVVGKANGTGIPQFVQNLQGHLQMVGDTKALAFFVQFGRNINSPFSAAISSSLRTNYLQNTSMAGFWAANRSTLPQFSTDINSYLSGNWSAGGTGAWFALTTQPQNNPYMLYQASQAQLANLVINTTQARLSELNWGQGFLSWCGAASEGSGEEGEGGTAPGDPCTTLDGIAGAIKTPATAIKAALDKVLGANQDKLVELGQLANEVGGILGNVATVMSTVNFAQQILGGLDSGGLAGAGSAYGSNRSLLYQYQSAPGYMGITPQTVQQSAADLPASSSEVLARVAQYETAWNTIRSSANGAKTALEGLANFCTAAADAEAERPRSRNRSSVAAFITAARAQADAARAAIPATVDPVIARADAATATAAAARAFVAKLQAEANTTQDTNAYIADLQKLQTMKPTTLDASQAQEETLVFDRSTASPGGSLNITDGSLVDQMSLLSTNASALRTSVCTFNPPQDEEENNNSNTTGD